jgi:hypothetical protein
MVGWIATVVALLFGAVWFIVKADTLFPVVRTALTGSFSAPGDGRVELPGSTEEYPTVDILVPAYEEGDAVGRAVRSIRAADCRPSRHPPYCGPGPHKSLTPS